MKTLLLSASPAAALIFAALPGSAATIPVASGDFVMVTGTIAGEYDNEAATDVFFYIAKGATLKNVKNADVIHVGAGVGVENRGTIDAVGSKADAISSEGDMSLVNRGTITSTKDAVNAKGAVSVTNYGLIDSDSDGIQGDGDGLMVTNRGTIDALKEGVGGGSNHATVTNFAGATITAGDDAIQVGTDATIRNEGTIINRWLGTGERQDAIDIDSGVIINAGSITAAGSAGIDFDANNTKDDEPEVSAFGASTVINTGVIRGRDAAIQTDHMAMSAQHIENSGLLEGTNGVALDLFGGNDSLTMKAGGTIIGASYFGTGEDGLNFDATFAGNSFGLFDGGLDFDTVSLAGYSLSDLASLTLVDDVFSLVFSDAFSLSLTNWDLFNFAGTSYSVAQMNSYAGSPAAVPLPAGVWLMLAGMGSLAALRRRKA